jgi:hypothetical protein
LEGTLGGCEIKMEVALDNPFIDGIFHCGSHNFRIPPNIGTTVMYYCINMNFHDHDMGITNGY